MRLRRTAAGMLEAERQIRRIIGYRDPARRAVAGNQAAGEVQRWAGHPRRAGID